MIEEHWGLLGGAPASAASTDAAAGGKDGVSSSGGAGGGEKEGGASKDISALLAAEVATLKDKSVQRFRLYDTRVKGCLFVPLPEGPGPSPLEVVLSILKEAMSNKVRWAVAAR